MEGLDQNSDAKFGSDDDEALGEIPKLQKINTADRWKAKDTKLGHENDMYEKALSWKRPFHKDHR